MNGDNPASTTAVSSCAYQTTSKNVLLEFNETQYYQLDNVEFTGLCESNPNVTYGGNTYVGDGNIGPNTYSDLYFHGWTHLPYSCSGGSGFCFNLICILGGSGGQDVIENSVFDGSDSDPAGIDAIFNALYDVHDSVIRYTANVLGGNCHTFHDNLVEYSYEPGDNVAHGNVYECNGEVSTSAPNTFYNNVIRNTGDGVGVGIWPEPNVGATDYYFNNVMYNLTAGGGNYTNLGQNGSSQGTLVFFINTLQNATSYVIQDNGATTYAHPLVTENNIYITNSSAGVSSAGSWKSTTDLVMSNSTATKNGYTSSQTLAYSPTLSSSPTVGAGTNAISSICSALSADSTAYAACQSSTGYGCTYNSTNHTVENCPGTAEKARPSSSAWDIGAYQYGPTPMPPTGVSATPVAQ